MKVPVGGEISRKTGTDHMLRKTGTDHSVPRRAPSLAKSLHSQAPRGQSGLSLLFAPALSRFEYSLSRTAEPPCVSMRTDAAHSTYRPATTGSGGAAPCLIEEPASTRL
jgi:hypothetical protein